jgi:molybdate transport system ATP-binding protein
MTLAVRHAVVRRGGFEVRASFAAGDDQTVALIGPNGAGKSTIVSALAGLDPLAEGTITLGDVVLDDAASGTRVAERKRPVGVVFQDLLLFPHLSALENVAFPLRARGEPAPAARERARALLDRLGLVALGDARPARLSGGELQRVALARALVHRPRLLLLDEPLSALDVRTKTDVRQLLRRELAAFDGVRVLVAHDPVDALTLADRVVVLEQGRVTQTGSPDEIRSAPRTPYAADLVGLNFFRGELEPLTDGAAMLVTAAGSIVVAPETPPPQEAIATLRPSDVSIHIERPTGSARNTLRGRVDSIWIEGGRARVRVASEPPVVADVTVGSLERLGIAEGVDVWAVFKAVEVRLQPA